MRKNRITGVFTRENDLSFISQGIGEIEQQVIGPFKKGPSIRSNNRKYPIRI